MDIERVKRIVDMYDGKPPTRGDKDDAEMQFVWNLWYSILAKHTKRTSRRILHAMTLEDLSQLAARYEIEREV